MTQVMERLSIGKRINSASDYLDIFSNLAVASAGTGSGD